MLNEKLEYDRYLNITDENKWLLLKSLTPATTKTNKIKKVEFSGIGRPLTILSRGFLEKCSQLNLTENESIELCSVFLKSWLSVPTEIPCCDKSIKTEIERAAAASLAMRVTKEIREEYRDRLNKKFGAGSSFFESVFLNKVLTDKESKEVFDKGKKSFELKNDQNKWSFSRVMAESYRYGHLKNQVFAIKPIKENCFGLSVDNYEMSLKLKKNHLLKVFCVVTESLRAKTENGQSQFADIQKINITNWLNAKDDYIDIAFNVKYKSCNLISKYTFHNQSVIGINEEWLKEYNVHLAPIAEAESLKKEGYLVFKDNSSQNKNDAIVICK